jgi:putative transposase
MRDSAQLDPEAILLQSSPLLNFHDALVKRRHLLLYTPERQGKPGPKGPSRELIQIIMEGQRRNAASAARG